MGKNKLPKCNARLIAAAPEMLEAMELLIKSIDHPKATQFVDNGTVKAIQNIRVAIVKARGKP